MYWSILNEIKHHKMLFSGASLELGKIHWYIQKADTEMNEVGFDEIHWWVFKKETNVEKLLKKSEEALKSVQKLKEDSFELKKQPPLKSYSDLIRKIKEFTEHHKEEIHVLYDYVVWLHKKDVLAPCVLFTYRVWGSTRLSDRMVRINANDIAEDCEMVKKCTEFSLGLRIRSRYTIVDAYWDILSDIAESADPEYQRSIVVPKQRVIAKTTHEVLDELAAYFEFIRQSLRNIILDCKKYNYQKELLFSENFWLNFIKKAMEDDRIETQLWDFKETFEMWEIGKSNKKEREKAIIKFCEQIASFANTTGGVLIVGVTDKPPREIKGLRDLENKLKLAKTKIKEYIDYDADFVHFQQILMKDINDNTVSCLIIAIAQTKNVVAVKDKNGHFTYPVRVSTGLERMEPEKIRRAKINIYNDNFDYLKELKTFLDK